MIDFHFEPPPKDETCSSFVMIDKCAPSLSLLFSIYSLHLNDLYHMHLKTHLVRGLLSTRGVNILGDLKIILKNNLVFVWF